jgi:hypothetical protein
VCACATARGTDLDASGCDQPDAVVKQVGDDEALVWLDCHPTGLVKPRRKRPAVEVAAPEPAGRPVAGQGRQFAGARDLTNPVVVTVGNYQRAVSENSDAGQIAEPSVLPAAVGEPRLASAGDEIRRPLVVLEHPVPMPCERAPRS